MKTKILKIKYSELLKQEQCRRIKPIRNSPLFRWLVKIVAKKDLRETNFTYENVGMDRLGKNEPCLILMNHSSFIDLEIAGTILSHRPYSIVATSDGFVGKKWLLHHLGCISTIKFKTDIRLIKDMIYCLDTLKSSVLMYPEASYSFDGRKTPLPDSIGKCVKLLGVPLVIINTQGAFLRDPLYNCLQKRNVKVSAKVQYVLSPEQISKLSSAEINEIIDKYFEFDAFKDQYALGVKISEQFRADGLNRILYKCPACGKEGNTLGKGVYWTCNDCGCKYTLLEDGRLKCLTGDTKYEFVSDWCNWEREQVALELKNNKLIFQDDVKILVLNDEYKLYDVGDGNLIYDESGFNLKSDDGEINVKVYSSEMYSVYTDFYWYEIGDMVCVFDNRFQYYCFPKTQKDFAAKLRFAVECRYKILKNK